MSNETLWRIKWAEIQVCHQHRERMRFCRCYLCTLSTIPGLGEPWLAFIAIISALRIASNAKDEGGSWTTWWTCRQRPWILMVSRGSTWATPSLQLASSSTVGVIWFVWHCQAESAPQKCKCVHFRPVGLDQQCFHCWWWTWVPAAYPWVSWSTGVCLPSFLSGVGISLGFAVSIFVYFVFQ